MKNRIKCQGCGKGLNADALPPRSVASCPNCGNSVTVPFPGMGAGKFAALYFGSWFAIIILVAMLGQVAAIVYLVWLGFKLWLGYQRAANIGWRPYACLWVLLPFIGALVLACFKTGEGLKRKKVDESGSGMPKPKDPTDISNERKAYVIIAIILLATIAIVGDYYFGS